VDLKLRETAERSLQMPIAKSQKLMYEIIENMGTMMRMVDDNENIVYMNHSMRNEFGDKTGLKCYMMCGQSEHCIDCISKKCQKTKAVETKKVDIGEKSYQMIASPVSMSPEESYAIEIFYDITEQKKLEEEAEQRYQKLKEAADFLKTVQRVILPENKSYWNAFRVSSAYVPCEDQGGDFYDVQKIDDNRVLFYIADVSGHGLTASMLTMFLRTYIRSMKAQAADLTKLLDDLYKSFHELKLPKEQYISLLCGVYNVQTRGLTMINAGHNCLPLVVECGKSDCQITELQVSGMPLCTLLNESNHETITVQMEKGDRIILYTDGLPEAHSQKEGKSFGMEGMMKVIGPNAKRDGSWLASNLILAAKKFSDSVLDDDMAIMVLEIL
jgi:phosphoserine phosphatase RsbU/P